MWQAHDSKHAQQDARLGRLLSRHGRGPVPDNHPPLELVAAYIDGAVTASERVTLQAHFADCPDCALTVLLAGREQDGRGHALPLRPRVLAIAASIVLVAISMVVYYSGRQERRALPTLREEIAQPDAKTLAAAAQRNLPATIPAAALAAPGERTRALPPADKESLTAKFKAAPAVAPVMAPVEAADSAKAHPDMVKTAAADELKKQAEAAAVGGVEVARQVAPQPAKARAEEPRRDAAPGGAVNMQSVQNVQSMQNTAPASNTQANVNRTQTEVVAAQDQNYTMSGNLSRETQVVEKKSAASKDLRLAAPAGPELRDRELQASFNAELTTATEKGSAPAQRPDISRFLAQAAPGSVAARFFTLAQSGWCYRGQCFGGGAPTPVWQQTDLQEPGRRALAQKLRSGWLALQPELHGVWHEIALATIKTLEGL